MSNDSMIVLQCTCGETYFAEKRYVGSQIKCACGTLLSIARLSSTAEYAVEINAKPDFRAEKSVPQKSFSVRQCVRIGFGIVCVVVALLVGYRLIPNPASSEVARVTTASPSPSATIKPLPSASTGFNYNGASGILPIDDEPERVPVSLANGANIAPPQGPRGNKYLRIINETDSDVAVKLVESTTGKTRRFFYVRAHSRVTIRGIGNEECQLRYSSGTDWDKQTLLI